MTMRRFLLPCGAALATCLFPVALGAEAPGTPLDSTAQGTALSLDDCRKIWNLAAGRSDLGPEGAKPYVDDFAAVDTNGDGKITNSEFRAGCENGLVRPFRGAD